MSVETTIGHLRATLKSALWELQKLKGELDTLKEYLDILDEEIDDLTDERASEESR